ncbi:prostaglandin E2 receptor EP4 subtype-like [Hemitrygon akajei]|uniref:prostaglandin E2 receptor EP4 subtype-like n=1 Tax=Hemitrygon akajei TaxID=2704970 RepID=UPI003BFA04BF
MTPLQNGSSGNVSWQTGSSGKGAFPLIPTLMFVSGVVGNLVAIVVLSRSRREQRGTTFYTLVCGLAVTDLLGTCLASPITIATYLRGEWPGDHALCEYASFVLLFFGTAGLSIICAMSLERYFAINHAYLYSQHMDKRLAALTLCTIYAANTLFCALPSCGLGHTVHQFPETWCFIDWRTNNSRHAVYSYMYAGYNSFLILVTVVCNVLVCGALIRMHRQFVRRTSLGAGPRPSLTRRQGNFRRLAGAEIQMVILLIATSAVVLICSSPLVVRVFINQLYRPPVVKDPELNPDLRAIRIASINPILDPWIYILLRKAVLNKLAQRLKCLFCWLEGRHSPGRVHFRHFSSRQASIQLFKEPGNGHTTHTLLPLTEIVGGTGEGQTLPRTHHAPVNHSDKEPLGGVSPLRVIFTAQQAGQLAERCI